MSSSFLRPKRRTWFVGALSVGTVSVMAFAGLAWWAPWRPGRFWGLVFGTLATMVFVIDGLYPLRRRLMGWPFGTAQRWLQFHLYGGALAFLFVLIHVGFRLPNGQFGWWLFGLAAWSTGSGLVGVGLQKWIPTVLASQLGIEALYDRIPDMVNRLQSEADSVVLGASDVLERFYTREIRPSLAGTVASWSFLVDLGGARERRLARCRHVAPFVSVDDHDRLRDLEAIVTEKFELEAHYSLQRALRLWLPLHLFPAAALLGLLTLHIFAVLYL
ncbi:MAG: hypothetical protein O3A25_17675 [Acidobacteria bacterium]|nr:hypothetical protein [Acidobacteriota bacterium]